MHILKRWYKYLVSVGINPLVVYRAVSQIARYNSDKKSFKPTLNNEEWAFSLYPILLDRISESATLGEYFWQDLFVAKRILADKPNRHIDVGSRIDGFVAHIACVRPVEVFDIRPLQADISNIHFVQLDITEENNKYTEIADCVSCLHTLEHIGLGRYGDRLDPDGWKNGFASLANLVKGGGQLWLSVPIGMQRVEFNAHRIFAPKTILLKAEKLGLTMVEFHYLLNQEIIQSHDVEKDMTALAEINYALGIFYFKK